MIQTSLFDTDMTGPQAHAAHGFRITPAWPIDVLCSLPAYQALRGPVVDLGVGGGALCKGIHERLPSGPGAADSWVLLDTRLDAIEGLVGWIPGAFGWVCDAAKPWPALLQSWVRPAYPSQPWATREGWRPRVVSNPPWSVLRCPACERQWKARDGGPNCPACKVPGDDLAQLMVRRTMAELPEADIWVLHLVNWPFHERRDDRPGRSAFWSDGAPASHRFAGQYQLASRRIAYDYPDGRPVAPHNVMSCWYHWTPTAHFVGQTIEIL